MRLVAALSSSPAQVGAYSGRSHSTCFRDGSLCRISLSSRAARLAVHSGRCTHYIHSDTALNTFNDDDAPLLDRSGDQSAVRLPHSSNLLLRPSPVVLTANVIANYWNFAGAHEHPAVVRPVLADAQQPAISSRPSRGRLLAYANCNFAALFPVFDVIFRTYHRPEKGRISCVRPRKWRSALLRPSRGDCVAASVISANSPGPGYA